MIKNKLTYLLALGISIWLMVMYVDYYTMLLVEVMIILPAVSALILSIQCRAIDVNIIVDELTGCEKGNIIPVKIEVLNKGRIPLANIELTLLYKNSFSTIEERAFVIVSAPENEKSVYTVELISNYCGNILVGLEQSRFYDFFKLRSIKRKINIFKEVSILPAAHDINIESVPIESRNPVDAKEFSKIKPGDDPSEVFDIRDYREGDKIQRIHWKLSMKQDEMLVKEFSLPIDVTVVLFVELSMPKLITDINLVKDVNQKADKGKGRKTNNNKKKNKYNKNEYQTYKYIDSIMELAMSISSGLLQIEVPHYLAWYDHKSGLLNKEIVHTEVDLYGAVEGILTAEVYREDQAGIEYYNNEYGMDQGSHMIYLTPNCSEEMIYGTSKARRDSRVTVIRIEDTNSEDQNVIREVCLRNGYSFISYYVDNLPSSIEVLTI